MSETSDYKQTVIGTFDRAAPTYGVPGSNFFAYYAEKLVTDLPIPAGAQILDLAAGRGALLYPAAEKVGKSGRVVGVDLSAEMVRLTSAEIHARGLTNAEMRLMDAEHLDFPDEHFDFVLCGFALFFFIPHIDATMQAIQRILKPGGVLGTITTGAHDERWLWWSKLLPQFFPADFVVPEVWRAVSTGNTPEKLEVIFAKGGLTDFQATNEVFDIYFANADDWWAWQLSNGTRMVLDAMTPDALARFKPAAYAGLAEVTEADGRIRQQYHALLATGRKPKS